METMEEETMIYRMISVYLHLMFYLYVLRFIWLSIRRLEDLQDIYHLLVYMWDVLYLWTKMSLIGLAGLWLLAEGPRFLQGYFRPHGNVSTFQHHRPPPYAALLVVTNDSRISPRY